jgi:hypothetical protein
MKHIRSLILFSILAITGQSHASDSVTINRVRFCPAPEREQAMVGGKITSSNVSDRVGFEPIAEVTAAPAPGQWEEIVFPVHSFFEEHCLECHDGETKKGVLDLTSLKLDVAGFETLVKVHDRVRSGEMSPKKNRVLSRRNSMPRWRHFRGN